MNKFIEAKLKEFQIYCQNEKNYSYGIFQEGLDQIKLEQFIKEALELQREELLAFIGKQEDCCGDKFREYMWFEKLKSEQELPRPKKLKQIDPIELEKNAKGFDDEYTKTKDQILKERLAKGFCTCSECIERDLEMEEFKEKHKLKV